MVTYSVQVFFSKPVYFGLRPLFFFKEEAVLKHLIHSFDRLHLFIAVFTVVFF